MPVLIECPRDAMQGIKEMIPAENKIRYINAILEVGFDVIDFGSFVSPKVIPQMSDTIAVLKKIALKNSKSKLLAIVANKRGAEDAVVFDEISYLGFPFSISETFQKRNTNSTISQSLITVEAIKNLCDKHEKELVIYISMGFGNPYGDPWNAEIAAAWINEIVEREIKIISLADTVGIAKPETIEYIFKNIVPEFRHIEFGAHLHTTRNEWKEKVEAAYKQGCRRFDGALRGYGGCPMASDELVGNMPTEFLINYFSEKGETPQLNQQALLNALQIADELFSKYN
jgi:hydroxymethylglutaryl-CoA lyase